MLPRDSARRGQAPRSTTARRAFLVDALELEFDLAPDATRGHGDARVPPQSARRRRATAARRSSSTASSRTTSRRARRRAARRRRGCASRDGTLAVLDPPDAGTLTVRSRIAPARNVALEGLYVSSGVFCTQCEPEGFRRITYFPDRPDVLARYTVTLRADRAAYPVLLSNGNLVAQGALPDGRHFATWHDPFPEAVVPVRARRRRPRGARGHVHDDVRAAASRCGSIRRRSNLPRCRHAMASLKRAMRWDEERFGREYDLDAFMIFCADDFNMGAMENKGLNIFNSRLVLADPATATDDDYAAIEGVIGHEYFHNWTGNRVTCRDWFQLSLKEGLTVFRDQEFSSDMGSRAVERIAAVEYLRREQFPEDAGPMAHPVRPGRVPGDQQLLHGDRLREGRRSHPHAAHAARARALPPRHGPLLRAPRRPGRHLRRLRAGDAGRVGRRPHAVPALVLAGRHAGGHACAARYDAAARTYTLDVAQRTPPTPGPARKAAVSHSVRGRTRRTRRPRHPAARSTAKPRRSATTRVLDVREARAVVPLRRASPRRRCRRCCAASRRRSRSTSTTRDEELAFLAAHDSDAGQPLGRRAAHATPTRCCALARDHRDGAPLALPPSLVAHRRQAARATARAIRRCSRWR